ncbi:hypothetical protein ACOSP7_004146 [Xanthoceras sorbifolium]
MHLMMVFCFLRLRGSSILHFIPYKFDFTFFKLSLLLFGRFCAFSVVAVRKLVPRSSRFIGEPPNSFLFYVLFYAMSSDSRSESFKASTSGSKCFASEARSVRSDNDHNFESSKSSLPPGITQGYKSEDYHREKLDFTSFAANHVRENRINYSRLVGFREEFSVPLEVGLRLLNEREQISNPELRCMAIHPAFLEIGVCLPLQPFIKRFLREVGLAPAQLSPNGWRILIGMWSLWRVREINTDPSFSEI